MTTDEQRMHQDEWLSALRSGDYTQRTGPQLDDHRRCVLRVGSAVGGLRESGAYLVPLSDFFGVSLAFLSQVVALNDGWRTLNPRPGEGHSFDEIADWFKAERDAHDGDLSNWRPS